MGKRATRQRDAEPAGAHGAASPMSAQLRPEAAPPLRAVSSPVTQPPSDPGEAAFDAWLKRELGRLYDATLSEPVPEELARLLDKVPPNGGTKKA